MERSKKWASKFSSPKTNSKTKVDTPEGAPQPEVELDTQNSIRMYLSEMGRVPLLTREQEVTLSRNIKEHEKELRLLVLQSPITLREISNWQTLLEQEEMTPKELMPRGRKTAAELNRMKVKVKQVAQSIQKSEKVIIALEQKIQEPNLALKAKAKYQLQLDVERNAHRQRDHQSQPESRQDRNV